MGFSDFLKSDTGQGLMSKALDSNSGGGQRQQAPAHETPVGASEGISQPADNVDHDNNGFKNVVKTVASFWFGGAGAFGGAAKGATAAKGASAASGASSGAAAGASSGAASNAVQQGIGLGMNSGQSGSQPVASNSYSEISQDAQQNPWVQKWGQYG